MLQEIAENYSQHFDGEVTGPGNIESLEEEEEEEVVNKDRWDEGGRSDCGYSDIVHDALMSIGGWVHGYVGEPPAQVENHLKGIGNFFQEASYAVRDFNRGTIEKGAFKFDTGDIEAEDLDMDNVGIDEYESGEDEPSDDEDV